MFKAYLEFFSKLLQDKIWTPYIPSVLLIVKLFPFRYVTIIFFYTLIFNIYFTLGTKEPTEKMMWIVNLNPIRYALYITVPTTITVYRVFMFTFVVMLNNLTEIKCSSLGYRNK
jgi:hypothetical protein